MGQPSARVGEDMWADRQVVGRLWADALDGQAELGHVGRRLVAAGIGRGVVDGPVGGGCLLGVRRGRVARLAVRLCVVGGLESLGEDVPGETGCREDEASAWGDGDIWLVGCAARSVAQAQASQPAAAAWKRTYDMARRAGRRGRVCGRGEREDESQEAKLVSVDDGPLLSSAGRPTKIDRPVAAGGDAPGSRASNSHLHAAPGRASRADDGRPSERLPAAAPSSPLSFLASAPQAAAAVAAAAVGRWYPPLVRTISPTSSVPLLL